MAQPVWFTELVNQLNADLHEEYEERAGIIEYDGGLPRDHAECLALLCILKAHPRILFIKPREKENLI